MVKHKNTALTSSNAVTVWVRTGKNSGVTKEPVHVEFVNMQDDEAAFRQFTKNWGPISSLPMVNAGWLGWRDLLRRAWDAQNDVDKKALSEVRQWAVKNMVTSLNFAEKRIELESDPLLGAIYLLFLRDYLSGKTAVCANPDCKTEMRYFIKARGTQKLCGDPNCSAYAQNKYSTKWWHEKGDELRSQRRKKAQQRKGAK